MKIEVSPVVGPELTPTDRTLHSECLRIGQIVFSELKTPGAEYMLFVIEPEDDGESDARVGFASNVPREDAANLMTGIVDSWRARGSHVGEPSVQTASKLRESVSKLAHVADPMKFIDTAHENAKLAAAALLRQDEHAAGEAALAIAIAGLALFDRMVREHFAPTPPPNAN